MISETDAYIGFSLFAGIGPLRFNHLLKYFGTAALAWEADEKTYQDIGLGVLSRKLVDFRHGYDPQTFTTNLHTREISVISRIDPSYPKQLLEIPDPPIVLFVKGMMPVDWSKAIGIVGTRKVTSYGRQVTEKLVRELVMHRCVTVSGMARGVDSIVHRVTLENTGVTVAVLGAGIDIIYPPEHKDLYFDIIAGGGGIISEVPPGHTVLKGLFPARNRIISGLSRGIIVTEGAEDSGSLITARLAVEQGRDVFAVPGPITSYLSAGPTKLIKDGAKVVTCAEDVLEELDIRFTGGSLPAGEASSQLAVEKRNLNGKLNGEEKKIVEILESGEKNYDEIVRESGIGSEKLSSLLTLMELGGIIKNQGNGKYGLR